MRVRIQQDIQAPPESVFETMAHIDNLREAVSDIVEVEFVGDRRRGEGTVFRETRQMGKRRATVEMEVVSYRPPEHLRLVSRPDSMGTVWDSSFALTEVDGGCRLELDMVATARSLLPRIANRLFGGMIRRAVERDMEAVRQYCEGRTEETAPRPRGVLQRSG